jgi:predicted dehydrogenase
VISLTLPTPLHVPLTVKALAAGVSVLCGKPMALNAADCNKMIQAAKKAPKGAKLMIAHCLRFCRPSLPQEAGDSKKYGRRSRRRSALQRAARLAEGHQWFADESRSGGVALDLHIHDTTWQLPVRHSQVGDELGVVCRQRVDAVHLHALDVGGGGDAGGWVMTPTMGFEATTS